MDKRVTSGHFFLFQLETKAAGEREKGRDGRKARRAERASEVKGLVTYTCTDKPESEIQVLRLVDFFNLFIFLSKM